MDLDQTTFALFKQRLTTGIAADRQAAQAVIQAAIAEAQAKNATYERLAQGLALQSFSDAVAFAQAHPEIETTGDLAENAFNVAKAKAYAELDAAATQTLAAQQELDRVGEAQYQGYAMMIAYVNSLSLADLITFASAQPGFDPDDPPTEETFAVTRALLANTVQARQTNDLAASQVRVNALIAQFAVTQEQATNVDVATYGDFQDWVAMQP